MTELEARDEQRVTEIRKMQRSLEDKNRALDALHYVWCNGGCGGGTHRWSEGEVTEQVVQEAERNTRRLREWWENSRSRQLAAVGAGKDQHE